MHEYVKLRCCMCPNTDNKSSDVCPSGTFKPEESPCRFVKTYIDARGWLYRVMPGINNDAYRVRCKEPDSNTWQGFRALPWCDDFDKAQSLLNIYAEKRMWYGKCK